MIDYVHIILLYLYTQDWFRLTISNIKHQISSFL